MKFFLLQIVLFLILSSTIKSQPDSLNNFVPDRPGMATPPNVLTSRNLQIEEGSQFEKYKQGLLNNDNFLFSSPLLRYGIVNILEVRIQTDYVYDKEKDRTKTSTSTIQGLNPLTIGSKIKLVEQRKTLPDISVLFNLTLPYFGNKEFRPANFAPSFYLLMSKSISEKLNVCFNYGLSWDGSSAVPTHFYALCLGVNLDERWSTFIENFGYFSKMTNPVYYIDTGFAYLINDRLQIDFSATGYLNSFFSYYSMNMGIAWKILQPKQR